MGFFKNLFKKKDFSRGKQVKKEEHSSELKACWNKQADLALKKQKASETRTKFRLAHDYEKAATQEEIVNTCNSLLAIEQQKEAKLR